MANRPPSIVDVSTLYGAVLNKAATAVTLADFDLDATPPDIQSVTTTTDASVSTTMAVGYHIAFSTNPHAAPVWDEVTHHAQMHKTSRGRQHELDRMATGTATVKLSNDSGDYWPDNGSSKFTGEVLPGRRIEIVGVYNGTTYGIFTGFIEAWRHGFEGGMGSTAAAVVSLECADGLKLFNAYYIASGSESEEASGTRVGNIADTVGWPSGDRDLDAGQSTIAATIFDGQTALSHLQAVVDTELGVLYVNGLNVLTYDDRHARLVDSAKATSQATYGDDGAELPYQEIAFEYDDQRIRNDIRITREGGTEQTASDSTSQSTYGLRTMNRTGLMPLDSEASDQALFLASRFKDAEFRIRSITIRPQRDPTNEWPDVLDFDFGTRITVRLNATSVDKAYHIEGIAHSYSATRRLWETQWMLSPADGQAYWILDTSTLGTGDFTTRLAY